MKHLFLAVIATGVIFATSCKKEKINVKETLIQQQNNYDKMIKISKEDVRIINLSKTTDFNKYDEKTFGKLNLQEAYLCYPSLYPNYYYVVINSYDTDENDNKKVLTRLLSVVNKSNNKVVSIILRAEAIKENQKFIAGQETFYSPSGEYIGCKLYNTNKLIFEPLSDKIARAKYGDFNDYYQSKKNECESDWLCDIACSFHPSCAVMYAGSCVIEGLNGNIDSWN